MKNLAEDWLFDIEEADVIVPVRVAGHHRDVRVPNKKALVARDTGQVVGVVGKGYRVITNRDAFGLCRRLCTQVFPDTALAEWELSGALGTSGRTRVALDLKHRTHVMNLFDLPGGQSEIYTPFVRVTNSYNGRRALRFDVGFMRRHCLNGVVFEEKVATLKAAHTAQGIKGLDFSKLRADFSDLEALFADSLRRVRNLTLADDESLAIVRAVLGWPVAHDGLNERASAELVRIDTELVGSHARYRADMGANAYAAFNTMTDIATRPPQSALLRREAANLQRRAGMWLKWVQSTDDELARDPAEAARLFVESRQR